MPLNNKDFASHTLRILEWDFITTNLAKYTRSPLGESYVLNLRPKKSAAEAQLFRKKTSEAIKLLERSPLHSYISEARDPSDFFDRSSREGILEAQEIWACGHFMTTLGMVGDELKTQREQAPLLAGEFQPCPQAPSLCGVIARSVSSLGDILDTASADLARLRHERTMRRAELETTLTSKVKDWHKQGLLQDQFFDVRDGRYVVPLRVESQSKLQGTLLGKSNTGQSVFVEPTELMIPNNALKEVDIAIRAEEFRILKSLSNQIGLLSETYVPWVIPVAILDTCFASAKLSQTWKLNAPTTSEHSNLKLVQAFHPAIADPVKNSFALEKPTQALLISGPNAGGKTVLLKATALAALMNNTGLFIAADKGSTLPHYDLIVALIGDDQSISQGLSSFSAQITEMKILLEQTSNAKCLIVVDEILSSTNPEEASALAQSLIEEFIRKGHHVLVSSHFSDLAVRLKSNPSMLLAAMEFESASATELGHPTYHIRLGELGSSHALEMAERIGLPASILRRARELVHSVKLDYDRAIADLKRKEKTLADDFEKQLQTLQREKDQLQENLEKEFAQKTATFMEEAQIKLNEVVHKLTSRTSEKVLRIQNSAKVAASKAISDIQEIFDQSKEKEEPNTTSKKEIGVGSLVRVPGFSMQNAQVLAIKEGPIPVALIQLGNFKMERVLHELIAVEEKKSHSPFAQSKIDYDRSSAGIRLDVRGKRYDEAVSEIEAYIDQAFRSGAMSITIITGHGTGALKQGLRDIVKKLPYIKGTHPERGNDDGATVIEFER